MAVSLYELMGTRYITNSLEYAFRGILEQYANKGEVIDLAFCKLGPNCAYMLNRFYESITFIDSNNKELNALLERNMQAVRDSKTLEEWPVKDLSQIHSFEDVKDLCLSIPISSRIMFPKLTSTAQTAACVFLIMTRPDIDMDLNNCSMDIYQFVHDAWLMKRVHHDKYIQFLQPELRIVECVNGYINTEQTGPLEESLFINTQKVLPYEFGSEQLILEGSGVLPEWVEVLNKVAKVFYTVTKPRRSIMDKLAFASND